MCIQAAHVKDSYDKLWFTQHRSAQPERWHRSGDVGHLDADGRLWIEGRMIHVITTARGPVTPVGIEQAVEAVSGSQPRRRGRRRSGGHAAGRRRRGSERRYRRRADLAPIALAARVRAAVAVDVAAVFVVPALPVDKRHNSKVDRTRVEQVGRRGARRRTDAQTVKVLVTGATQPPRRRGRRGACTAGATT